MARAWELTDTELIDAVVLKEPLPTFISTVEERVLDNGRVVIRAAARKLWAQVWPNVQEIIKSFPSEVWHLPAWKKQLAAIARLEQLDKEIKEDK